MKYITVRKTLVKISILTTILMVSGLIAIRFTILDKKYIYPFIYTNIIVQTLIIVTYILTWFNNKNIKIIRHQFENKFISGGTNIFPEYIFSTNPRNDAIFKIYYDVREFAKDDLPEIYIDIIKGRNEQTISDIKNRLRNIKVGIEKDIFLFKCNIMVMPNEKINFKFRKDVKVKIFILEEVYTL